MAVRRWVVSLRVWHPSWSPEAVTSGLGRAWEPDHAWHAGEARVSADGTRRTRAETYWSRRMAEGSGPGLAAGLGQVAARLATAGPFLGRVRAEGGRAELFVGWFMGAQGGEALPAGLLAVLGGLGVDLSFDVYAEQD